MKKLILMAATAASITFGANTYAINVDGITFDEGAQLWTTTLWEHALTGVGDTLYGVGIVRDITGPGGTTWTDRDNNKQLTYYFHDFTVLAWYEIVNNASVMHDSNDANWGTAAGDAAFTSSAFAIDFAGGIVDMYSDSLTTGTELDPSTSASTAVDIANATDGNLWLQYVGHTYDTTTFGIGTRSGGSLYATNTQGSNIHASGSGAGYLDVSGTGLAATYLDTDSYDPNLNGNRADALIDSSYSTTNPANWNLSGSLTVKTDAAAIPEPVTLSLMGIGLIGMGFSRKRN